MAQTDWFGRYDLTTSQQRHVATVRTCLKLERCPEVKQSTTIRKEAPKSRTRVPPGKRMCQQIRDFKLLYAELEEQACGEADASYRKCQQQLHVKEKLGEKVLTSASRAVSMIDGMKQQHAMVADKARSLRDKCETLLADHQRQNQIAKNIQTPMKYFEDLTSLGSLLGLPLQEEATLVSPRVAGSYSSGKRLEPSSQAFREALHRVSECLAFMDSHSAYQDAATYRAKYLQLQTRALKLLRNKVVDTLRAASASAKAPPVANADTRAPSFLARMHNQLIEFRTNARTCVQLIRDIEGYSGDAEYVEILEDVHQCFFEERAALVGPALSSHLRSLVQTDAASGPVDVLGFCRSALAVVSQLCHEEYDLFYYFFGSVSPAVAAARAQNATSKGHKPERVQRGTGLFNMLCQWTGPDGELSSILRPRVIAMSSVDKLCKLIQLLKVERHSIAHANPLVFPALEPLLTRVNGDIQERLIYRAECHILEYIQGFKPAPKDLNYPAILTEHDKANATADKLPKGLWFPTVERTLICLSKVYRSVDVGVFEELAYECVLVCANSLMRTSAEISRRQSPIDAHLFLVRHLLLMRAQLQTFEMDFTFTTTPTLHFEKTRNAFRNAFGKVVDNKASMFALSKKNSIFELLQDVIPSVDTREMDPKKILDEQLKSACRQFIDSGVASLLNNVDAAGASLQQWLQLECDLPQRLVDMRAHLAIYLDSEVNQASIYKPVLAKLATYFSKAEARIKLTDPRAGATTESLQRLRRIVDPAYASRNRSVTARKGSATAGRQKLKPKPKIKPTTVSESVTKVEADVTIHHGQKKNKDAESNPEAEELDF